MDRRDFMKKAILSSLMLSSGALSLLKGKRSFADYHGEGTLLFCIDATGAWDPTSFCDPLTPEGLYLPYSGQTLGSSLVSGSSQGINQFSINTDLNYIDASNNANIDGRFVTYGPDDLQLVTRSDGTQFYAAPFLNPDGTVGGPFMVGGDDSINFFENYKDELLFINGINTRTNAHSVGQRHSWSGRIRVGAPHLAALWAAIEAENTSLPMGFSSTGGYDATADLITVARAGKKGALIDLTDVYGWSPSSNHNPELISDNLVDKIINYQNSRTDRMLASSLPPHIKSNIERLQTARLAEKDFGQLANALAEVTPPEDGNYLETNRMTQAHILISAMKAGICKGAMLVGGGFDTHSNHFEDANNHPRRVRELFQIVHYVRQELQNSGLWNRTIIMISSDFGRTRLNGGAKGKDHAPVTSFILMGGEDTGIGGGRTVGQSYLRDLPWNEFGNSAPLKASKYVFANNVREINGSLANTNIDDPEGFNITPSHIHYAMRELLGINGHPYAETYALPAEFTSQVYPFFTGT